MKLKVKILLLFLPCFLGAFFLLGHYHAQLMERSLEQRAASQVEALATVQANRLNTLFNRELERLALVSSRTQLRLNLDSFLVDQDRTHLGKIKTILAWSNFKCGSDTAGNLLMVTTRWVASLIRSRASPLISRPLQSRNSPGCQSLIYLSRDLV